MKTTIIFLGLLIILSSFVSATLYDNDSDLIAWYKLDEAGGSMIDYKDNALPNFDCTYNGALQQQTAIPSYSDYSLGFDGTNDVCNNTAIVSHLNGAGTGITVSAWWTSDSYDVLRAAVSHNFNGGNIGMLLAVTTDAGEYTKCFLRAGGVQIALNAVYQYKESMFTCRYNGTHGSIWVNNTQVDAIARTGAYGGGDSFRIGDRIGASNFFNGRIDEVTIFNRSLTDAEILDLYNNGIETSGGDSTPPALLNVNCTSCNIPYGDTTEPFETEDTTPTFRLDTDEPASCRIHSSDIDYDTMGASRDCEGGGTEGHTCTLKVPDRFTTVGQNNIYISCIDGSSNENKTGLLMEIKGATETHGDDAIELGIDTSEIAGMVEKYASKQVSARNLADNQFSGIFDWVVAVQGSALRYAFNYVSEGESPITGLFNLTPVLYVLQLQNQTNETITDEVGKLINSTYP